LLAIIAFLQVGIVVGLVERFGRAQGVLGTAAFLRSMISSLRLSGCSPSPYGPRLWRTAARTGSLIAPAVANLLCWAVLGAM
jgi:hypothetical protein